MKTAFAVVALFAGASAFNGKGASGVALLLGSEIAFVGVRVKSRLKMIDLWRSWMIASG